MEHYNLIIADEPIQGINIIRADNYRRLIQQNPERFMKNPGGDFYSKIPVQKLAYKIQEFDNLDFFLSIKLIQSLDITSGTLLENTIGVNIYVPEFHSSIIPTIANYTILTMQIVNYISSPEKKGSLQIEIDKTREEIEKLKKELGGQSLDSHLRELGDFLESSNKEMGPGIKQFEERSRKYSYYFEEETEKFQRLMNQLESRTGTLDSNPIFGFQNKVNYSRQDIENRGLSFGKKFLDE